MSGENTKPAVKAAGIQNQAARVDLTRARSGLAIRESIIKSFLQLAAIISVAVTASIVFFLIKEAVAFFDEVSIKEFLGTSWVPLDNGEPEFGIIPLVISTFLLTGIALSVAIPIGLLTAIYLSEFAKPKVKKRIKPVLELLAGVPTIVFGFFALTFFTPNVLRPIFGAEHVDSSNVLSAGIIVGLLIVPIVASIAEDAMAAVPSSLREGAYGLGSDRRQVATRVVFPAALSGIVAAVVLAASRAIGETMVVLLAAGSGTNLTEVDVNPLHEAGNMAGYIAAPFGGDLATGSIQFKSVFMVALILFVITLLLNLFSTRLVAKFRQVYD